MKLSAQLRSQKTSVSVPFVREGGVITLSHFVTNMVVLATLKQSKVRRIRVQLCLVRFLCHHIEWIVGEHVWWILMHIM